jgi:plastocyanin
VSRRLLLLAPAVALSAAFILSGAGPGGPAAAATPGDVAPCTSASASPVPIASPTLGIGVNDYSNFYDPSLPVVRRGTTVVWSLTTAMLHHTVTDTSGMLLFDSGSLDPGQSCAFTFTAAGDYDYFCVFHTNMTGRIHVPVWVGPSVGTRATTFKLVWASAAPAPGYAFDVKVLRPHRTLWRQLQVATSARGGTFVPHAGSGVYRFKARLRQAATGTTSGWSLPAVITVG